MKFIRGPIVRARAKIFLCALSHVSRIYICTRMYVELSTKIKQTPQQRNHPMYILSTKIKQTDSNEPPTFLCTPTSTGQGTGLNPYIIRALKHISPDQLDLRLRAASSTGPLSASSNASAPSLPSRGGAQERPSARGTSAPSLPSRSGARLVNLSARAASAAYLPSRGGAQERLANPSARGAFPTRRQWVKDVEWGCVMDHTDSLPDFVSGQYAGAEAYFASARQIPVDYLRGKVKSFDAATREQYNYIAVDRFRCCLTKGRGTEGLRIWLKSNKNGDSAFCFEAKCYYKVVVSGKFFVDVSLFSVLSVGILSHKFHCFLFMISSICVCFPYSFGGCAESAERGSAESAERCAAVAGKFVFGFQTIFKVCSN